MAKKGKKRRNPSPLGTARRESVVNATDVGADMAEAVADPSSSHTEWDAFSHRHAGSRSLELDPLYSLSEELIDSIVKLVPGFFSSEEVKFERDLARTARFGFFLHTALGLAQVGNEPTGEPTLAESVENTSRQIDDMIAEELQQTGADPEDIRAHFTQHADQRARIVSRQSAYAGWLLLNSEFRAELRRFRERWEGAVRAVGRFPRLPMWLMPDPTERAELPPDFRDECYRFFCRWGLETLLTWDWPIPMEPDLNIGLRENLGLLSSGGMFLFVPWYLLRGEKLDMKEVVRQGRLAAAPDHLRDWVNKRGHRKGQDLGDERYSTIQWLYRYFELALMRRYADACKGNQQRLDHAFASVIKRTEETIKQLRLEALRAIDARVPGQTSDEQS